MYIIDTNIHTQLYSRKLILLLFFSLTGVISLTSPFLQSSLHLTSLQDSLNLFINDIQIIPGLNDLFVKIFNEFRIPFFLIACLLFNIVSFCLINAQPFGFFCFLYFSRWQRIYEKVRYCSRPSHHPPGKMKPQVWVFPESFIIFMLHLV